MENSIQHISNGVKKKLLFVITKSNWGGAQRYVYDLATSLPKDAFEIAVAFGGTGQKGGSTGRLKTLLDAAGIRTLYLSNLGRDIDAGGDLASFREIMKVFRKEKPDIVHLNSSKAGGLGALAARMAGVKQIVFTVHGWAYNEPVSPLSKFFRWSISLITLLLSHKVIAVSEFDSIHSPFGLPVTTIHIGIAMPTFLPREESRAQIVQAVGIPHDTFVMGTIAELHKNKGLDILVEAFALTKNGHLVVIGEGEERERLERLIRLKNLKDRVHLVGFIENAAVLLKGFDIFLLPSRKEGLPYTILEAGAAELPVIASIVGGIPEIIDDQLSGILVPAYDPDSLAEALNELMESPATRARYGARLKEKVERYFPLRGMIKKTMEVYEA